MNVDKSIQRLKWRFEKGEKFLPNQNDFEALDSIMIYINKQREIVLDEYQAFAKLFVIQFTEHIKATNGNYDIAFLRLRIAMKTPLKTLKDELYHELNYLEFKKLLKDLGYMDSEDAKTKEDYQNIRENNFKIFQNHQSILTNHLLGKWDYDKTIARINLLVPDFLNNIQENET